MVKVKLSMLAAVILIAISCKKELSNDQPATQKGIDPTKVFKVPTTSEQKLLVTNLGKVTEVLKELYKNKANLKVVNAAIFSKTYIDESVLIKDLIYPEKSLLTSSLKFKNYTQKWNVSLSEFPKNFWIEANKTSDATFTQFLNDLNIDKSSLQTPSTTTLVGANGNDVSIYFPYSEEYLLPDDGGSGGYYEPITSIVTATADADEGWGSQPFFIAGIFQNYAQVLVNDDYCFNNPTQIIGVNGIEIDPDPNGPPPPPPLLPGVSRLYIGEGICKKQYDRLISFTGNGGGSEIKYCHLSAYLVPINGQVTTFQDIVSIGFSRKDINKKRWIRAFTIWDDDWVPNKVEQILAIYEEDNTNSKTVTGSVSATETLAPGTTITGTVGYSVTVTSQDDIIRNLKVSRNSYFAGAFQNQGQDFSPDDTFLPLPYTHGWPVYDVHYRYKTGANVGFTWPYNTF